MAHRQIELDEFLRLAVDFPVLDVRSPAEYGYAHIPKAINFPLFTNEERAIVGTIYKQVNREAAIKKGLEYFGPKLNRFIEEAEEILKQYKNPTQNPNDQRTILVHCWRGGMRSAGIAWLLDLYGYNILTLKGGYKIFRNWVLGQFTKEWKIRCLGGYTGSGKTEILESLRKHGCQVIDLEFLAKHKGSAFGGIGQVEKQPSQEMFENELALSLHAFESKNESLSSSKSIWLEDESQRIGAVNIPQPLWEQMKVRELLFVDIPFKSRLSFIVDGYGKLDRGLLMAAISRLQKKLGGLETKNAISFMIDDNIEKCFQILLVYYDKLYSKAFQRKQETLEKFAIISFDAVSPDVISKIILERYGKE